MRKIRDALVVCLFLPVFTVFPVLAGRPASAVDYGHLLPRRGLIIQLSVLEYPNLAGSAEDRGCEDKTLSAISLDQQSLQR